jgi:hypothetical protein
MLEHHIRRQLLGIRINRWLAWFAGEEESAGVDARF